MDGLSPLEPLDVNNCRDLDELLQAMAKTAFGARKLGRAAGVLHQMLTEPAPASLAPTVAP